MTTNFVDDAGRNPALLALLRSGARDTIDLVYAGVPVSAHVRPLRSGLPWTLVVYRGHELEDRLGGLTAALSIFFTLLWPVLVALPAGLVLLLVHWCKPEHWCKLGRWCRLTRCCKPELAGIPATLRPRHERRFPLAVADRRKHLSVQRLARAACVDCGEARGRSCRFSWSAPC